MLSSRLVGNNVPIPEQSVEPSAAGTLRMMTAQHNASLNVAPGNRTPQELLVIQQQQIQQQSPQQPRRTLSNITNSSPVPASPIVGQIATTGPTVVPQSPSTIKGNNKPVIQSLIAQIHPFILGTPPFSPGRAPLPRPQFYGHNPNLKLPNDLFLLGCHFLIVEYEDSHTSDLPNWKKAIAFHGGEIETSYNLRVTHVLCRTQKHGIVMQAIRDNKRLVENSFLHKQSNIQVFSFQLCDSLLAKRHYIEASSDPAMASNTFASSESFWPNKTRKQTYSLLDGLRRF